MKLIDDLEAITEEYLEKKVKLEELERDYALRKAETFLKGLSIYKNAEARDAGLTVDMERDQEKFLDYYYTMKNQVRALMMRREVLMERIKTSRIIE